MHHGHEHHGAGGAYSQNPGSGQQAGEFPGVPQVDGFGSSQPQGAFVETGRWSGNDDVGTQPIGGAYDGQRAAHGGQGDTYGGQSDAYGAGRQGGTAGGRGLNSDFGPASGGGRGDTYGEQRDTYGAGGQDATRRGQGDTYGGQGAIRRGQDDAYGGQGDSDTYGAGRQGGSAHTGTGITGGSVAPHSSFAGHAGSGGRGEGNIDSQNDGYARNSNSSGGSAGDKLLGSVEKVAGKITGNAGMVERGEARKLGNQDENMS